MADIVWTNTAKPSDSFPKFTGNSVFPTKDEGFVVTGSIGYQSSSGGMFVSKTDSRGNFAEVQTTIIDENYSIPRQLVLRQNHPNPFNPNTLVTFELPISTFVNLSVFDVNGQLIETLVNRHKSIGIHSVNWNAQYVSSGIYFFVLRASNFSLVKKGILVK